MSSRSSLTHVPDLDAAGLLTPEQLVEIGETWDGLPVVMQLLAHLRVLHYRHELLKAEHESLKAWAQAVDPEAYRARFEASRDAGEEGSMP